jgi:two-component system phosphate regulon sensor histidine kinase PhoR
MTSSFFRRLLFTALFLVAATLFAVDYTLTRYPAGELGATQIRERILAILLGAAMLAFIVAFLVSRSLSLRVRHLKLLAEGFPGGARQDRLIEDSNDELSSLERSLAGVAIELRRLLDRLHFESARREAILSGMAEGVLAVDRELRVTFCNAAFLRAIDFRGASFEGRFLLELIRDPDFHTLLRSVLAAG